MKANEDYLYQYISKDVDSKNPENKIILFWSTYDSSVDLTYDKWIDKKLNISAFHLLSLLSHIKLKNDTTLYSYHKFNVGQVPEGIKIKDANKIFCSKEAFEALQTGHSIAHISDLVRLTVAANINGVVIDMDAVCLKKFPSLESYYGSMPAKLSGGVAPKWGKSHPPLHISDNSWDGKGLFMFPAKINNEIKHQIIALTDKIKKTLQVKPKKTSKAWNYVMWGVKDTIKNNSKAKVFKPIYFCPLTAWLRKGKCYSLENPTRLDGVTKKFGVRFPSIEEIFEKTITVQHFFESAGNLQGGFGDISNNKNTNTLSWANINEKCLLAQEALYVIGKNWRQTLLERELINNIT